MTPTGEQTETRADLAAHALRTVLAAMAGPDATPRADQVEAVSALVTDRRRVLLVQATGWGKSAVYWAATAARRQQGAGPTLVISPLLALMRDQVAAAERAGVRARTINSANADDWQDVFDALERDEVDVLLVSPERLANPRFEQAAMPLLERTGLLVVDEAHCISDWGFDFRPDYQRLTRLLSAMSPENPVLATTATANARVTEDVAAQLGTDTLVLRGPLARSSLRLSVIPGLDGVQRMAWVADALERLPGSGIVYGLTVDQVTSMAGFLSEALPTELTVAAYTGATPTEERASIEADLRANRLKAVVATSALGMGYDKPDLGFCIHVGSPDSPVAYYQQVGRAGRALDEAVGVLLPAPESDERIWDYFATATIPDPQAADRLLRTLNAGGEAMTVPALESETGLRRGRLEALLKTLRVDGAVERVAAGWVATGTPWHYDADKYERVVAARRAEAALMRTYAAGARCLMQVLTEALDDPDSGRCGRCSVCTGTLPPPGAVPDEERVRAARRFLRQRDVVVEPRRQWPGGLRRPQPLQGRLLAAAPGRAVAFADDPAWRDLIAELSGPDGTPSDELRAALVQVLVRWRRDWEDRPVAVVAIPSRSHPRRVHGMAAHLAEVGRLPLVEPLVSAGSAPDDDVASSVRVGQLMERLTLDPAVPLPDGPVLLVDDVSRTRWTLTVASALLRSSGVPAVLPVVGHQRP
ncbi:MAG TPA: DEAD/DEAH box helicase [Frankiaceae bacterium]|nr:DEAD/DEAH box helicase [Frankiaceae bacterium]